MSGARLANDSAVSGNVQLTFSPVTGDQTPAGP
jgi:hypothetical protein